MTVARIEDVTAGFQAAGAENKARKNEIASIKSELVVNAKNFGSLTTDARPAIEAAMDYVVSRNPLGGVVELPEGVINVGWSGQTIIGRRVGIQPRSNVTLRGQGSATILRVANGANIDLIANNRYPVGGEAVLENFYIQDMVLDGNAANQNPASVEGWNVRLWGFKDCGIRNVRSINPNTWGIRIEYGDGFVIRDVVTRHGPQTNSDGIHFTDVDNVIGGGLDVRSEGDDAFIIDATQKPVVQNYGISGLIVRAENQIGLPARGCLILVEPSVNTGMRREVRNVSISGFAAYGCGSAVCLYGGDFTGISVTGTVEGGKWGLVLQPGNENHFGLIQNCNFDLSVSRTSDAAMFQVMANGKVRSNRLRLGVVATAPSIVPVSIQGEIWDADISVDYTPATSLPAYAIDVRTQDSSLKVMTAGCAGGLTLNPIATGNSFFPKRVVAVGGHAININGGASNNAFSGGKISGTVQQSTPAKFFGVSGAENYNVASLTTDATGLVTVTHGLSGIPASVVLTPHTASVGTLRITGRTATDFTVKAVSPAGADIVSSAIVFSWRASL